MLESRPDIVVITECFPKFSKSPFTKSEFSIPGYDMHWNQSQQDCKRGIIIYTKEDLKAGILDLGTNHFSEALGISINVNGLIINIIGIHRIPNQTSPTGDKQLFDLIKAVSAASTNNGLVLLGDFNLPSIIWENGYGYNATSSDTPTYEDEFLQCVDNNYLHQHIDQPTRFRENQTPNQLDLVFVNHNIKIDQIQYQSPLGKSDHVAIEFTTDIDKEKENNVKTSRLLWEKGNYETIKAELNSIDWEEEFGKRDTETSWQFLKSKIKQCVEQHIPITESCTTKKPPWLTKGVREALRERNTAWKKFLKTEPQRNSQHTKVNEIRQPWN